MAAAACRFKRRSDGLLTMYFEVRAADKVRQIENGLWRFAESDELPDARVLDIENLQFRGLVAVLDINNVHVYNIYRERNSLDLESAMEEATLEHYERFSEYDDE